MLLLSVYVLALNLSLPLAAQAQAPGLVWCSDDPILSYRALVERTAPVLWFSPDEPLLHGKLARPIPSRLRFEPLAAGTKDQATVYHQLKDFTARGNGEPIVRERNDLRLDLALLQHVSLQFYFYYPSDFGFGSHPDDLESAVFVLSVEQKTSGCAFAVRIREVRGHAHGSDLYSNILRVSDDPDSDVSLPITLLIEEGKHATVPDRNGDGYYTPGYDSNHRAADAWGLRDTLRGGRMVEPTYNASMTKVRSPAHRVGPSTAVPDDVLWSAYRPMARLGPPSAFYVLRPTWEVAACTSLPGKTTFDLCKAVGRFDWPPEEVSGLRRALAAQGSVLDRLSVAGRYDTVREVATMRVAFGFEMWFFGGWVAPGYAIGDNGRFFDNRRIHEVSATYSPSAARWREAYLTIALQKENRERREAALIYGFNIRGETDPVDLFYVPESEVPKLLSIYPQARLILTKDGFIAHLERAWRTEYEVGYKFRFRKLAFWHAGAGIRWTGLTPLTEPRLILQVGLGPW